MCPNAEFASSSVKYVDCYSLDKMSPRVLQYHWFHSMALFKSFGLRHSLRLPSDFTIGMIELIHSVCVCTSMMIPSFTSLLSSALYADCMSIGTDLGGCCTGL